MRHHLHRSWNDVRVLWLVPFLLTGFVACQEEAGMDQNPPVVADVPATTQEGLPSPANPPLPDPARDSTEAQDEARTVTGQVISIEDDTYVVQDPETTQTPITSDSMTLVDEGLAVGDKAEVRLSAEDKPLAIRKIRENSF